MLRCRLDLLCPSSAQAVIARWAGVELVKTMLFEKMRDAMRKEVEKLLEEVAGTRPAATRFTRKEAAKRAAQAPVESVENGQPSGAAAPSAAAAQEQDVS
jgi:hypothetical protein